MLQRYDIKKPKVVLRLNRLAKFKKILVGENFFEILD